ncbi:hypothetical protein D1007_22760 [Hordeum vulgare]|nr:hypothetical protein D1007_22760 [Hordeum vulgare]
MQEGPILLRQDGDGDHHRHELLPGGALPLRPQRHSVRQARKARAQRQAPPLRHHRHRVHTGAVRVPGAQDRVPRGGVLEPRLLRGAGGVRGRRRRRGAGGPHGVAGAGRRKVDEDEGVVGLRLAPRLQPPPPGAILHPHPQRVRQDARRQQGHPGQLEAQHLLPLLRAVQLKSLYPSTGNATTQLAATVKSLGVYGPSLRRAESL